MKGELRWLKLAHGLLRWGTVGEYEPNLSVGKGWAKMGDGGSRWVKQGDTRDCLWWATTSEEWAMAGKDGWSEPAEGDNGPGRVKNDLGVSGSWRVN